MPESVLPRGYRLGLVFADVVGIAIVAVITAAIVWAISRLRIVKIDSPAVATEAKS